MEFLIFWAIFAGMCYLIAEKNGRDTRWAIIWGALFGVFAVLGYLIAGKPRK
jgi:hypothetical protein